MDLFRTFKKTLQKRAFVEKGNHVLVALSGGPDSVALFDLFYRIRQDLDLKISVGHYNHELRGSESEADELFVKNLCQERDVEFRCERGDVSKFAKKAKLSIEQAARIMRYDFLERTADSISADVIATGHTANDQAETVLDRLIRGSGITGLKGIPERRDKYIRPLLGFRRHEIMAYIKHRNLEYCVDSSNRELNYRRNRIRHELLPLIKQNFNPRIVASLNRLAHIMSENEAFLLSESQKAFEQCIQSQESDKIVLDILCFLTYFKVIQKYMVLLGIEKLGISKDQVDFTILEQVIYNVKHRRSGKFVDVGRECQILVAGHELVFRRILDEALPNPVEVDMQNEYHPLWDGIVLKIKQCNSSKISETYKSNSREVVDSQTLTPPVKVRVYKKGDRFYPLNLGGSKKLSDFFTDEKIPIYRRKRIPILECNSGIVWVCGYRLDERFKITPNTEKYLQLEIIKAGDE